MSSAQHHDYKTAMEIYDAQRVSVAYIQQRYGLKKEKAESIFKLYQDFLNGPSPHVRETIILDIDNNEPVAIYPYYVLRYENLVKGRLLTIMHKPYLVEKVYDTEVKHKIYVKKYPSNPMPSETSS